MKKLFILAVSAIGAAAMTSCGQGNAKLASDTDSLAYAIGVDMGTGVFTFDSTLNPDMIGAAIKDVFAKKGKMTREEAMAFIQEYMTTGVPRKNAAAGKKFIDQAVKDGAKTLPSGLAYKVEKPGADKKVALGDSVFVRYILTLPNGQELDKADTDSVGFLLEAPYLIPGWLEGVPLIGEGGKITLFVPGELGYGEQGNRGIAPNQALKFDIEVVKVIAGTPKDTTATPAVQ